MDLSHSLLQELSYQHLIRTPFHQLQHVLFRLVPINDFLLTRLLLLHSNLLNHGRHRFLIWKQFLEEPEDIPTALLLSPFLLNTLLLQ